MNRYRDRLVPHLFHSLRPRRRSGGVHRAPRAQPVVLIIARALKEELRRRERGAAGCRRPGSREAGVTSSPRRAVLWRVG